MKKKPKPLNPNILPELLGPIRDGNRSVRALARLFNDADPHSRRALFRWACEFTAVPESLADPIHKHLLAQAFDATGARGSELGLCKAVNKYEARARRATRKGKGAR